MSRGIFITFEGPDGTGKSTQIERLNSWLTANGHITITTREPGGTALGEAVRRIILDSRTTGLAPRAELALMFAARAEHIAEVIRPALAAGKIVLCDRFTDSSEAYQGYGRDLGSAPVLALHHHLCEDLQPDLTLLLMFPEDATANSLTRAQQRNAQASPGEDESRFESEGEAFQQRVAHGYAAIAARDRQRVHRIDASGSIDEVHIQILNAVQPLLSTPSS
jgi:dTMP kinase